jgi:hypothetical protein
MAWPFSTAPAPTFDTGLGAVPNAVLTVVTAASPWLLGAIFSNPTGASITIRVTNTAGDDIVPTMEVPAGMVVPLSFPFLPAVGLKWVASAVGLKGQLWGYV